MQPRTDPTEADLLEHAAFVRALACRLLGDEHAAEDVVQETWMAAMDAPERRRGGLRAWLAGIVKNRARMRMRSDARRRAREDRAPTPSASARPDSVVARLEMQQRLVEAVLALDEPYRTTVTLRYFDGLSPAEIARRHDVPVGTVYTRLRRALDQLRAALERDDKNWRTALVPIAGVSASLGGGAASAAATAGVLVMSTNAKWGVAACIVLVLGGFAAWQVAGFDDVDETVDPEQPIAVCELTADDEPGLAGLAPMDAPDAVVPTERDAPLTTDVTQPWPYNFRVRVVDSDKKPVFMARVRATADDGLALGEGTTAEDGRIAFRIHEPVDLIVSKRGVLAPVRLRDVPPEPITVELHVGGTITGTVISAHGEAVPCAVQAYPVEPGEAPHWPEHQWYARTDDKGAFTLRGLLPGEYWVSVRNIRAKGRSLGAPPDARRVEVGSRDIEIRLIETSGIVLRVIDDATGRLVEGGVDLYVKTEDGSFGWWQRTTGSALSLAEIPGTFKTFRVESPGYAPSEPFDIAFGEAPTLREVALTPDPYSVRRVAFHVRDADGRPFHHFEFTRWFVRESIHGAELRFGNGSDIHDVDGRFVVDLPRGRHEFEFRATYESGLADGDFVSETVFVDVGEDDLDLPVVIARGGTIWVRHPRSWKGGIVLRDADGNNIRRKTILEHHDGGRLFGGLAPGKVEVTLLENGVEVSKHTVTVKPDETTEVPFDPSAK